MRKWHSKEDRKGLEQIYVSFPKMCSSLDPLVYLEMLGGAAAQEERAALAQPVMALSHLEMWQLWAHCHRGCTVSSDVEREETLQTFKEVQFCLQGSVSPCLCITN